MKAALIATTRNGIELVSRLGEQLPQAELVLPERFASQAGYEPPEGRPVTPAGDVENLGEASRSLSNPNTLFAPGELGGIVAARFQAGCELLCCLSVGAVVRLIAPHLKNKAQDPAVIAFDEQARYVVPVVGGHIGGANARAEQIAAILGAQAVITTASDSSVLPAVDLLGRDQGWQVEASRDALCRAAAAMVNGEPLALIEEDAIWQPEQPPPPHLRRVRSWQEIDTENYAALLWVTKSWPDKAGGLSENTTAIPAQVASRLVIYRP